MARKRERVWEGEQLRKRRLGEGLGERHSNISKVFNADAHWHPFSATAECVWLPKVHGPLIRNRSSPTSMRVSPLLHR